MATEDFKRKLTAVFSADVVGYSRLMGDDEEATVRTITTYREVMTGLIQGYNGRVVDAKGDNLLAEFPSVVDAVRCAVEIQKELMVRNTALPEHRRMEFRIGINLGDVIEEKETIYGDGVNIAARLESLAEGGEICISEKVYGEVKKKLSLEYKDIGEHSVKNIDEPVRAYRVLVESGVTVRKVSREKKAWLRRWQKVALVVLAILVVGSVALAVWNPDPREVSPRMFVFFLLTFGFRYFFASISLYP